MDAVDQVRGNTALHLISQSSLLDDSGVKKAFIELLINSGAHVDCVNVDGQTPLDVAIGNDSCILLRSKKSLLRLKCLCARVINDQQLIHDHLCPTSTAMKTFLHLHGDLKRKRST